MQFFNFHLMPWPHVPEDFDDTSKYPSAWVTFSNEHYDPTKGRDVYNRYLDELEYAETLGFDGVCVNEHHQNTYGTMALTEYYRSASGTGEPIVSRLLWSATGCRSGIIPSGLPKKSLCWMW